VFVSLEGWRLIKNDRCYLRIKERIRRLVLTGICLLGIATIHLIGPHVWWVDIRFFSVSMRYLYDNDEITRYQYCIDILEVTVIGLALSPEVSQLVIQSTRHGDFSVTSWPLCFRVVWRADCSVLGCVWRVDCRYSSHEWAYLLTKKLKYHW